LRTSAAASALSVLEVVGCGGTAAAATESADAARPVTSSVPLSRKPSSESRELFSWLMDACERAERTRRADQLGMVLEWAPRRPATSSAMPG